MSFAQGAGFRVCGSVVRRWTNPAGTFATLTLDVFADGRGKKLDFRAFKEVVNEIGCLTVGAIVEVTGTPDVEKLTAKDKTPVTVDGREVWVTKLTVRAVKTEASSRAPAARNGSSSAVPPPNPDGDQNDPANW